MMPSYRSALWMLLLAVLLAGCAGGPAPVSQPDAAASSPVVGPRWNLLLVGTSDRLDMPTTPFFQITPDGRVSGHDGCNRLTGRVELGPEQRIAFEELAATRMACARSEDAARVRGLLENAYAYLIDHDRLVLLGPNGRVLGGFRRGK